MASHALLLLLLYRAWISLDRDSDAATPHKSAHVSTSPPDRAHVASHALPVLLPMLLPKLLSMLPYAYEDSSNGATSGAESSADPMAASPVVKRHPYCAPGSDGITSTTLPPTSTRPAVVNDTVATDSYPGVSTAVANVADVSAPDTI